MAVSPLLRRTPAASAKEISVLAWLFDDVGNVLLVQQATQAWTLPGGKVRARESIADGLKRELFEETGLRLGSASLVDVYDRPEKASLALLYFVTARKGPLVISDTGEILQVMYAGKLPRRATPSARYFWRRHFPVCTSRPKAIVTGRMSLRAGARLR